MRFPIPEQYGMMSVPSTVPSNPPSLIASNRQMSRKEAAMKMPRKAHGAQMPVLSTWCNHEFKARSKSGGRGRAKTGVFCEFGGGRVNRHFQLATIEFPDALLPHRRDASSVLIFQLQNQKATL